MKRDEFLKQLPGLVENYQPSPGVLERLNNLKLLMIVGPSGVGKTSIINRLDIKYVPSDTTRQPRPGEKEGRDFFFRTDYDQIINEIQAGLFVQIAVDPEGDLKGTIANVYPLEGWIVMAVITDALDVFRHLGFKKTINAYVVPPSYREWMQRIKNQGFDKKELKERLDEAKRSLHFALTDEQMHFILNDELEKAASQTKELIAGKESKKRQQEARQIAATLRDRLNEPS